MNIIESNIANLPTKHGKFKIKAYKQNNQEHLAVMSENFEKFRCCKFENSLRMPLQEMFWKYKM